MTVARILGRALSGIRAGECRLAWNNDAFAHASDCISLASPAFGPNGLMPVRFAGQGVGDNISPPLTWTGVPEAAAELVLILEDPDAPLPRPVVHLIAARLSPRWPGLAEGALSGPPGQVIRFGRGSFGRYGYAGPRPLPGHGPHRYVFQLAALRQPLPSRALTSVDAVLSALKGCVLARGRLTGTYETP